MRITDKKRKKKIIILSLVIVVTLAVIWGHSCMSMEDSSEESGFFFDLLCPFLELFAGKGNVTEHFIRKMAHFTEFMGLGLELMLYFRLIMDIRLPLTMVTAWVTGTMCALIDETVQIFSGRGSMIADVWLDSAGCVTGVLIMTTGICLYERKLRRIKKELPDNTEDIGRN